MSEQPIGPEMQKALDRMAGIGCVVRYQYGNQVSTHLLQEGSPENEAWQDAAFTNGPPLIRIIIEFAPTEAETLIRPQPEAAP